MTQSAPVVNHHAGQAGFAGPIGSAVGLVMLVAGRRRDRMVADLAAVTPSDHVVDIGCGPGGAAGAAARRGARVTGVDPAPAMLRLARIFVRERAIRWVEGASEELPLPDGTATVAWATATVHHWPDVTTALTEIHRVLTPGGRFVTMERDVAVDATGLASHGWTEAQARTFADLCRAANFTDVRVDRHAAGRRSFWAVRAVRP
ncbi:class I SAM-dependent methyltransferase [Nocardia sp. BMG51109]|uniref:class I SAM-dependent methyltransferase n=1 Tax=Nocardia sp. BMG51109 TaxID=1056816 RepID=UPI0004633ECE|nr:class I SAM-dependent methyltransferase [Nocardia sp. BMG51109]